MATTLELVIIAATTNPALTWSKILARPETIPALPAAVQAKQERLHALYSFENTGAYFTNPETLEDAARRELLPRLLIPLIHAQHGLPGVAWPASLDLAAQSEVLHELNQSVKSNNVKIAEELNIAALITPSASNVNIQVLNPKPRASLILEDGTEIAASYREVSPSHVQIETTSKEPATLIVRDTYYPGWQARVDNDPAPMRQIQRIFRGLDIPAGNHIVEMRYRPTVLLRGIILSAASLAILGFTLLRSRLKLAL